jgi:hypothetical protein
MKSFLSRFHAFDRLRFCGKSRLLNHARGVQSYCHQQRILFKDLPTHAQTLTYRLCEQTKQLCGHVPLQYLNSPDADSMADGGWPSNCTNATSTSNNAATGSPKSRTSPWPNACSTRKNRSIGPPS